MKTVIRKTTHNFSLTLSNEKNASYIPKNTTVAERNSNRTTTTIMKSLTRQNKNKFHFKE